MFSEVTKAVDLAEGGVLLLLGLHCQVSRPTGFHMFCSTKTVVIYLSLLFLRRLSAGAQPKRLEQAKNDRIHNL